MRHIRRMSDQMVDKTDWQMPSSQQVSAPQRIDVAAQHACEVPSELECFFQLPDHFAVLHAINGGAPPVSLRALAWFVSNGVEDAQIRADYENQLKTHTRRRFDPFRRCTRLEIKLGEHTVMTTVGQMNFFKWMIETGLWKFVADNRARVSAEVARHTSATARSMCNVKGCTAISCAPGFSQVSGPRIVVFD